MSTNEKINGINTFKIAQDLADRYKNLFFYVSHGAKKEIIQKNLKLYKTRLCIIEKKGNESVISDVDISILKDELLIGLIEIEEKNTISPKKIFSDVLPFYFFKTIYINSSKIKISDNLVFALIGYLNGKGKGSEKEELIEDKLKSVIKKDIMDKKEIKIKEFESIDIKKIVKWIEENVIAKNI